MSHLQSLQRDLVERRLWPVALLLVAALVAVPVFLRHGSDGTPVPTAPAVVPALAAAGPVADLAGEPVVVASTGRGLSRLPRRDPFVQRIAKGASAGTSSATIRSGPGTTPSPAVSPANVSGSVSSPSPVHSRAPVAPPRVPAHPPRPRRVYTFWTVDLRFGFTDHTRARPDLARLSALPSQENPIVVFDGLAKADHRTALFTVSSDATPDGDGTCAPDPKSCLQLQLKPGEREFLTIAEPDGTQREYQLDFVKVDAHRTFSRAAAVAGVFRPRHARRARSARAARAASTRRGAARDAGATGTGTGKLTPLRRPSASGTGMLTPLGR